MVDKRILVTGGCGFIGSEVVTQLVAIGHEVLVLDNLSTGCRENLTHLPENSCHLIEGDVRDADLLHKIVPEVSTVFHLACLGVRHSLHSPLENHEVNALGTLTLLDVAKHSEIERFIYVSTSEVYGNTSRLPITEESPTFPRTPYGASKLAGECYSRTFHSSYSLPVVIVRPFNAFGPRGHHEGDSGEVIPRFMLRLLAHRSLMIFGDGKQTRDFTFVEDTARAILLAAQSEDAVGHTFNIGSGTEISINELTLTLAEVAGVSFPTVIHEKPRPSDVRHLLANTERARDLLGFVPRIGFKEGLSRLLAWYIRLGITPEKLLEDEILYNWRREETQVTS